MAIAPRLDLRQSQTLVMTPQLRQAIKLLQYSNIEVAAFVEEELERNPLLERDEAADAPPAERAALDQIEPRQCRADGYRRGGERADTLPSEAAAPLDTDHAETYDAGGAGRRRAACWAASTAAAAIQSFEGDDRGIDDLADGAPPAARPSRRAAAADLCRSGGPDDRRAPDRPALPGRPADRRTRGDRRRPWRCRWSGWRRCAASMMRFDPAGLFARDLKECLAAQLADRNRLDPAMQTLLDNLELLARRETRKLMALCGVDSEDLPT